MEINEAIYDILKEFKIGKNKGTLALLAIYFKLDAGNTIDEETIKAINLTKIVEKNHNNGLLTWNMPLFKGQQMEWNWVEYEYNVLWKVAPARKDSNADCTKRMQELFKKNPAIRKDDVMKATKAYMATQRDPQFVKRSALFITEGVGAKQMSMLIAWIEKTKSNSKQIDNDII